MGCGRPDGKALRSLRKREMCELEGTADFKKIDKVFNSTVIILLNRYNVLLIYSKP